MSEEISERNVLLNGARQIALATPRKKKKQNPTLVKCVAVTLVWEELG